MRTIRRLTGALCAAAALTLATPAEPVWAQSALAESGLIGELEGVTIITDPAQWPTSFSEAPSLAEKVAAGELPPVEERLPEDLMVIQPVDEIGQLRRHLAARLHRPRRQRERQPHPVLRSPDPGRPHRCRPTPVAWPRAGR